MQEKKRVRESEREKKRENDGGRVVHFLWASKCGSIICFLEGVVQKQPAGELCLLYLIETESVTPWLETQWKCVHTHMLFMCALKILIFFKFHPILLPHCNAYKNMFYFEVLARKCILIATNKYIVLSQKPVIRWYQKTYLGLVLILIWKIPTLTKLGPEKNLKKSYIFYILKQIKLNLVKMTWAPFQIPAF